MPKRNLPGAVAQVTIATRRVSLTIELYNLLRIRQDAAADLT